MWPQGWKLCEIWEDPQYLKVQIFYRNAADQIYNLNLCERLRETAEGAIFSEIQKSFYYNTPVKT